MNTKCQDRETHRSSISLLCEESSVINCFAYSSHFSYNSSSETEDEMKTIGEECASNMEFENTFSKHKELNRISEKSTIHSSTSKPTKSLSIFQSRKVWPEMHKKVSYKQFWKFNLKPLFIKPNSIHEFNLPSIPSFQLQKRRSNVSRE